MGNKKNNRRRKHALPLSMSSGNVPPLPQHVLDQLPDNAAVVVVERPVEVPVHVPEGPAAKMTPFEEYPLPDFKLNYWQTTYDFDSVTGHRNNIYEVYVIRNIRGCKEGDWWVNQMGQEMHWLSIKRIDQRAIIDWRHFQQIKSELVGPENEAFQLHPAESRCHDTANQFHLFVFAKPFPMGVPIGWMQRDVTYDAEMNERLNSRQRPFSEESPNADLGTSGK